MKTTSWKVQSYKSSGALWCQGGEVGGGAELQVNNQAYSPNCNSVTRSKSRC